jgi:hypothetical protein
MKEIIASACDADAAWAGAECILISSLQRWWDEQRGPMFEDADLLIEYLSQP